MKQQDIEDLRQLIEFLKQHQVAEFDIDRGDLKIRLKFNPQESGAASLGDLAWLRPAWRRNQARSRLPIPRPGCTWLNRRSSVHFSVHLPRVPEPSFLRGI